MKRIQLKELADKWGRIIHVVCPVCGRSFDLRTGASYFKHLEKGDKDTYWVCHEIENDFVHFHQDGQKIKQNPRGFIISTKTPLRVILNES